MPKSITPKNSKPGPFSRDRVLASVDCRTKAGRKFRSVIRDLGQQIGGDPSPAQALLIQSAALKATRLFLLSERILDGGEVTEGSDHHALAWLNSLRLDLQALGLERRVADKGSSLADIIARHKASEGTEARA